MTTDTRTQYRAICPACFAQQAVTTTGKLVNHGYTRPQQWHQNVGTCSGAGEMHFGTTRGRDYTVALVANIRQQAKRRQYEANELAAGRGAVWGFKRDQFHNKVRVEIADPTPAQRAAYAAEVEGHAGHLRLAADDLQSRVKAWQLVAPVAVTVEAKGAPLVHWSGGHWQGGKACAGSYMGAMKGFSVRSRADVTCPKCKATRQWALADAKGGR